MEKTTQDKETKEKFEEFVTKECGGDLWGDDGTGHYEASLYDVKDKVWDFISSELDKAREEGKRDATEKLRLAFHEVFFKSGELWFDYLFEDGDIEAEQDAREMVEEYWEEVVSKLKQ